MSGVMTLDIEDTRRVFFCGDVHGEYDLLMSKLEEVDFSDDDILIFVGDLIDRGPSSIKCLNMLDRPNFYSVLGNHELMALNYLSNPAFSVGTLWFENGGNWFRDLRDDTHARESLEKVKDLPRIIEVNHKGKKVVVCHADYPQDEYVGYSEDMEFHVVWNRNRVYNSLQYGGVEIKGADAFVFGHTPIREATCIKTKYTSTPVRYLVIV